MQANARTIRGVQPLSKRLHEVNKWYAKLKRSGFVDIERADGQLIQNQTPAAFRHKASTHPACFQTNRDYYLCAGQFLWDHPFGEAMDRAIWAAHADGLSNRTICRTLKLKYHRVFAVITGLQVELRTYIAASLALDDEVG